MVIITCSYHNNYRVTFWLWKILTKCYWICQNFTKFLELNCIIIQAYIECSIQAKCVKFFIIKYIWKSNLSKSANTNNFHYTVHNGLLMCEEVCGDLLMPAIWLTFICSHIRPIVQFTTTTRKQYATSWMIPARPQKI